MSLFSDSLKLIDQHKYEDACEKLFLVARDTSQNLDIRTKAFEKIISINKKINAEKYFLTLKEYGQYLFEEKKYSASNNIFFKLLNIGEKEIDSSLLNLLLTSLSNSGDIEKAKKIGQVLIDYFLKTKNAKEGLKLVEKLRKEKIQTENIDESEINFLIFQGNLKEVERYLSREKIEIKKIHLNVISDFQSFKQISLEIINKQIDEIEIKDLWKRRELLKEIYEGIIRYPMEMEFILCYVKYLKKTLQNEKIQNLDKLLYLSESKEYNTLVQEKEYLKLKDTALSTTQNESREVTEEVYVEEIINLLQINDSESAKIKLKELKQSYPQNKLVQQITKSASHDDKTKNAPSNMLPVDDANINQLERLIKPANCIEILTIMMSLDSYSKVIKTTNKLISHDDYSSLENSIRYLRAKSFFEMENYFQAIEESEKILNLEISREEHNECIKIITRAKKNIGTKRNNKNNE